MPNPRRRCCLALDLSVLWCAAPAEKQTVGGKQVATGGPGHRRTVAKRVSVATPKAREAAAAAKKPVARAKKTQGGKSEE